MKAIGICFAALLLLGCSAGDLTEPTAETEQAISCPKSVSCNVSPPGYDYFVYAQDAGAGSAGVRCWWRNTLYQMTSTIVSDGGCPACCPSGSPPQPGGCQSVQYATAWTCRAS